MIDPIVPNLQPSVESFFPEFGAAGTLCESWPVDAIYVNTGGALTAGSCDGVYRDLPEAGQFPTKPRVVRQLPIGDGLATGLMHRMGLETASSLRGRPLSPSDFRIRTGSRLLSRTRPPPPTTSSTDSNRLGRQQTPPLLLRSTTIKPSADGYASDTQARQGIVDWYTRLFDTYPDLALVVTEGFASGLGPAATYDLTMTTGGDTCTMRVGAVWNLDDDGLIADEYVYYDPETVLACGWAQ